MGGSLRHFGFGRVGPGNCTKAAALSRSGGISATACRSGFPAADREKMQAAERNKGLVIEPGRKAHRGSGVTPRQRRSKSGAQGYGHAAPAQACPHDLALLRPCDRTQQRSPPQEEEGAQVAHEYQPRRLENMVNIGSNGRAYLAYSQAYVRGRFASWDAAPGNCKYSA
jgi:hypothetical protein